MNDGKESGQERMTGMDDGMDTVGPETAGMVDGDARDRNDDSGAHASRRPDAASKPADGHTPDGTAEGVDGGKGGRWTKTMTVVTAIIAAVIILALSGPVLSSARRGSPAVESAPAPSSTPETQQPAPADTQDPKAEADRKAEANLKKARVYDWGKLKGQRMSNAYKITSADGIDMATLTTTMLTDDGKQVINPANWIITDLKYHDDRLTITLHHEKADRNGTFDRIF